MSVLVLFGKVDSPPKLRSKVEATFFQNTQVELLLKLLQTVPKLTAKGDGRMRCGFEKLRSNIVYYSHDC